MKLLTPTSVLVHHLLTKEVTLSPFASHTTLIVSFGIFWYLRYLFTNTRLILVADRFVAGDEVQLFDDLFRDDQLNLLLKTSDFRLQTSDFRFTFKKNKSKGTEKEVQRTTEVTKERKAKRECE